MRIRTHTNPFNYFKRMGPVSFEQVFSGYTGGLDLEVGFGRGLFLRRYAATFPQRFIVGVEVRKNVVKVLEERVQEDGLNNVYLIHGTVQIALEDCIPDRSLERVFVFHPDPWFKKSHHKRRVINPKFMTILRTKMKPGACLYISTDVQVLWQEMQQLILDTGYFKPVKDPEFWANNYHTNWQAFSVEDRRESFYGTFQLDPLCQNEH